MGAVFRRVTRGTTVAESIPMRLFTVCIALSACFPQSAVYDADHDDDAMAALTRTWSGGGATLSLCEDVSVAASTPGDGCQIENVTRGGGLGEAHSEQRGGCGGCPLANEAFVSGTISGGTLPDGTAVSGNVFLGSGYDDDPYAFPYTVVLSCTDVAHPCSVTGTLESDGSLHLTVDPGGIATTPAELGLSPTGDATCAAP
jgi:hypothetical protein